MENRKTQIDDFFHQYAKLLNMALKGDTPDVEVTASNFSDCFIEASPLGVHCGKNDEQFRTMIPRGYSFYKSIGITKMNILTKTITLLDDYHSMTKIHWESGFVRTDNSTGSIEFDVIYFIQTREKKHKIFAYITGDEQAALKENGLI